MGTKIDYVKYLLDKVFNSFVIELLRFKQSEIITITVKMFASLRSQS
jgi:hypothetical protein